MILCTFSGGPKGHIEFDGIKHVLRTILPVFFIKLQTSLEMECN
jgi:hypothetical protein